MGSVGSVGLWLDPGFPHRGALEEAREDLCAAAEGSCTLMYVLNVVATLSHASWEQVPAGGSLFARSAFPVMSIVVVSS